MGASRAEIRFGRWVCLAVDKEQVIREEVWRHRKPVL